MDRFTHIFNEELASGDESYLKAYNEYVANRRSAVMQVAAHIKFFKWAEEKGTFNSDDVMKAFNWPVKRGMSEVYGESVLDGYE